MSLELRHRLYDQLQKLVLIDPHTHINPYEPASRSLADILGYHYYTELAHSAGLSRDQIEDEGLTPRDKVGLLIRHLGPVTNTIQYSWFVEACQGLLGFQGDRIDESNWEEVFDLSEEKMGAADWSQTVLQKSGLEAVFLTNDFDDSLEDFDASIYIPCLRTDDLVFHLTKSEVRNRLERATDVSVRDVASLRRAIERLFRHFKKHGARACAISLPPDFSPQPVTHNRAGVALDAVLKRGAAALETHVQALKNYVFWTLAEMCDRYSLPFDLMIGVNRQVYAGGVFQGRDLFDSRVSLIQYKTLFNAFPHVTFPISVLASVTNQELASYAWIFPNVVTHGHWWYSNTPTFIEHDLSARLEAVPRTKQIGYYSDMYKLEFALPKFNMYKRILSKVLAERYVVDRGWSEEQAVELGQQLLRGNVEQIFGFDHDPREETLPEESEFAGSTAGPAVSGPIGVGDSEAYPQFPTQPAGGIGSAMAGIGTAGAASLGGTDFSPEAYQPTGLRDKADDFVFEPSADMGNSTIGLTNISSAPESGFALDESDQVPPGEEELDMNELDLLGEELQLDSTSDVEELALHSESLSSPEEEDDDDGQASDIISFDGPADNQGLDPGLHFRHLENPHEHVAPMISDHANFVESEEKEREASELDLDGLAGFDSAEEMEDGAEEMELEEAQELDLDLDSPADDGESTVAFEEEDVTSQEPPSLDDFQPPVEEPKKQGGGEFDFLK